MGMNCEIAVDELVATIGSNFDAELKQAIRNELMDRVLPIVDAAAVRIASKLKTRVVAFKRVEDGRLVVNINIDGAATSVV